MGHFGGSTVVQMLFVIVGMVTAIILPKNRINLQMDHVT